MTSSFRQRKKPHEFVNFYPALPTRYPSRAAAAAQHDRQWEKNTSVDLLGTTTQPSTITPISILPHQDDVKTDEKVEEEEQQDDPNFHIHKVRPGENLISVAVRYNTTVNALKRFNADLCLDTHLDHVDVVRIPRKGTQTAILGRNRSQKDKNLTLEYQARKEFKMRTNADDAVTNYYLKEHDFDLKKAYSAWKSDDIWDKRRQFRKWANCDKVTAKEWITKAEGNLEVAKSLWEDLHGKQLDSGDGIIDRLFQSPRTRRLDSGPQYELVKNMAS